MHCSKLSYSWRYHLDEECTQSSSLTANPGLFLKIVWEFEIQRDSISCYKLNFWTRREYRLSRGNYRIRAELKDLINFSGFNLRTVEGSCTDQICVTSTDTLCRYIFEIQTRSLLCVRATYVRNCNATELFNTGVILGYN